MKKAIGWAACLGLAGVVAWAGEPSVAAEEAATAVAVAAVPSIAAAREPEIRHLDRETDAADLKRIWRLRKKLPEEFVRRNNFGWAWADIEGLEKKEYFAHSGIQNFNGLSARAAKRIQGISFSPEKGKGRFQTLFVDYLGNIDGPNAMPRWFDTEYKMLEDIAARLPDPSVSGRIRLYTNLEPCPSCRGVMKQFMAAYTNIEMVVFYEWPP